MAELKRDKVLRRVLRLFAFGAILPIGVAATISYFQVSTALTEQAYARLYNANKFHGTSLLDRLLDTESKLLRLAQLLPDGSGNAAVLLEQLAQQTQWVAAPDEAGRPRTLFGPRLDRDIPAGVSAAATRLTGRSTIFRSPQSDEIFLDVNFAGATYEFVKLVALLDPIYLFGKEEDHVLTTDFCVFEESTALYCTMELRPYRSALESIRKEAKDSAKFTFDTSQGRYFAASRDLFMPSHFNSHIWTLLSVEDEDTVFAPISVFRWLFPGVVTLSILCILLLVVSQVRRQLTPLSVLRKGALQLGDGDFESRISLDTGDEFEELAGAFNGMADKLGTQFGFLIAMSEIDAILLSSPDLIRVTESMVRRLPELIPVSVAAILVADAQNSARGRIFINAPGVGDALRIERTAIDDALLTRHADSGHFVMLAREGLPEFLVELEDKASTMHLFPLFFEQRLLGCLCLGVDAPPDLSEELLEQARSVADRLTVALSAVERQRRLYEQAHYDSLTGLPNRALFVDRLGQHLVQAQRSGKRVALIYADLDHFKLVNDTLGHSQGDEVLKQAADRFRQTVRGSDTVARLSGDEFVFALPELIDARDALKVVEGIGTDLDEPFLVMGQQFILGASMGIAIYPEDGSSAEDLLKNADVAMYRAKSDQSAKYRFFEESMNEDVAERSNLGQQLRQAISAQQLQLAYQPKVDPLTKRIHSVEALMRWHHPQMGWVSPARFIPIAEEIGLIERLGEMALNSACEQFARWRAAGLPIQQVAVNVSSRQVLHGDIVKTVKEVLERTGLPASCLELELTESLLVDDYATTHEVLFELQQLGVGLALDDFGTGYSSLSHLHQLPFDTLKIDQSFVQDLGRRPEVEAIIISIIALAKSLDKKIVAEGIERDVQRQFLTDRGCQLLQGYFYSKPLPPEQLTAILEKGLALPLARE